MLIKNLPANLCPLIQCFKFGHLASSCYRIANCRFCSEKHDSKNCPKREVPLLRCIHCSGSHEANSVECPVYVKVLEYKLKKAKTYLNVKPNSPLTCNDSQFPIKEQRTDSVPASYEIAFLAQHIINYTLYRKSPVFWFKYSGYKSYLNCVTLSK